MPKECCPVCSSVSFFNPGSPIEGELFKSPSYCDRCGMDSSNEQSVKDAKARFRLWELIQRKECSLNLLTELGVVPDFTAIDGEADIPV